VGVVIVIAGLGACDLPAQTVTRDPATGDLILRYVGLDAQSYSVLVEAMSRVDPVVTVVVERDGARFAYHYSVENRQSPQARQPLFAVQMPCAAGDASLELVSPAAWHARVRGAARRVCSFSGGELLPGQRVDGFVILSNWLPAIGNAYAQGLVAPPALASGEDTPPDVARLIRSFHSGLDTANSLAVSIAAPLRSPAAAGDPARFLRDVSSDVTRACALGWISNAGVCNSLQVKLDQASRSLERGNGSEARGQLGAFLQQLEAQHGPEPGKHVNDSAYWLLKINAEYLLGRM
jgi:hypothetical protein